MKWPAVVAGVILCVSFGSSVASADPAPTDRPKQASDSTPAPAAAQTDEDQILGIGSGDAPPATAAPEAGGQPTQQSSGTGGAPPATTAPEAGSQPTQQSIPLSGAASGQTEPPRHVGVTVEEIIVTAEKREESINRVPISVSAFTGNDLQALGIRDTQSLSHLVPGLNTNENGGNTTTFTLRGVGFNDTTYTSTGTVGNYIDEVNLPYSPMTRGPVVDIKRVEVLKGPQGTLYGRNTTGGLINYIPNEPKAEFGAGGSISYGRFDTIDANTFVTGKLFDSLNGRFALRVIHSGEGWQESITRPGDRLGRQAKLSGRIQLDWKPADSLLLHFDFEGFTNQGDAQAAQPVAIQAQNPFVGAAALSPQVSGYPGYQPYGTNPQLADWVPLPGRVGTGLHDTFGMAAVKGVWHITDTLQSTTILSALRMQSNRSADLTTGLPVYNADTILIAHILTGSFEERLSGSFWNDRFKWMMGVNASHDGAEEHRIVAFDTSSLFFPVVPLPPPLPPNLVSSGPDLNGYPRIIQRAVFLNTDTNLTDDLKLTLGSRYTAQSEGFYSCSFEPADSTGVGLNDLLTAVSALTAAQYTLATGMPGHPVVIGRGPGQCFPLNANGDNQPFRGGLNEKNLTLRQALSWQINDDTMLFESLSRGFKAGGFPVGNAAYTVQYTPVVNEELRAAEVGLKQSLFDNSLHIDLSAYYYRYKNKQLLTHYKDPIFGALPLLKNAPHSHIYGIETSIQATPLTGFYVALAGSYLRTRVDEFTSVNFSGQTEDFAGKPFNFAPQAQVTIITDYTRPLSDHLNVGVGADAIYSSGTNGTLEQGSNYVMRAYRVFGVRAHMAEVDNRWGVELWGRNVTNELVNTGAFNLGDTVVRYTGMPLTFGITLNYNYM